MFRKPLTKFQQLRLLRSSGSASGGILPQLKPKLDEDDEYNHINDINNKIKTVLSQNIAIKPLMLESISKYYFGGEVWK